MKKYTLHSFFEETSDTSRRPCRHEDCDQEGLYPAPRSRKKIRDYYWFCLEHVRAYNKKWNYYAGMNPAAVEQSRREDVTWERPTWSFATRDGKAFFEDKLRDPLGFMNGNGGTAQYAPKSPQEALLNPEEIQAMTLMKLTYPFSEDQLKIRYKKLAKQYHPDLNQGSKKAEERFKKVNLAYATLRKSLEDLS